MRVPFIDLEMQNAAVEAQIRTSFEEVFRGGHYILGPEVSRFETLMAGYHGVSHAVGVASGTDALVLALLAAGVGRGDEVITTPFTFVATAESIMHAGARPVFADIDENTYNMDPAAAAERVTGKTAALLPVHLYGLPADMGALASLASRKGLKVIEDCAQSTGARSGGRLTGSLGDAAALSFFPTKNLGGLGDGGMVLTKDDALAAKVLKLRGHGATVRDHYELLGFNSRLDSIQAGALAAKLPFLEEWNEQRRGNAALYRELLGEVRGLVLPGEPEGATHVYNQFTVATDHRDELKAHLEKKGIGSMVYYSEPLHTQPVFAHLGARAGDYPVAERACRRVLSLPVFPGLSREQVEAVAGAVAEFFGAGG